MKTSSRCNAWLICPVPNPQAKLRLFCFHHAGGGALSFRAWSDKLPPCVETCLIELPGRSRRLSEPPFTHLKPLIQTLEQAILSSLDKPFAFFGHSMGALISFELARQLRKEDHARPIYLPVHLFVSGRHAPQYPVLDPPIHALPEPAFLRELRHYNGTPEEALNNVELMQLLLPTLRADFAVLETYFYSPEPPLDCPITAFGGLQDGKVSCHALNAWREQTNKTFSQQMFPGDHFFFHSSRSLLLQSLSQELQQIAIGI